MALLGKFFSSGDTAQSGLGQIAGCTLGQKLAESSMSTVYLTQNSDGLRIVAKVLTPHGNRIAEKLSVKLGKPWEGERVKTLSHPNVVQTFSCGKERGNYYILMEYLSGGSFGDHLRARTREIMARRLDILLQAANGLAYVHEKGIIHRDICPKNLMFDSEGTGKLIDFGVAIHRFDRLKQTEIRTGRPSYLAPELIRQNRFDIQTDIYAFGVMMYETLAGERPFHAPTREELMNLHLRAEPVPPSQLDASVSAEADSMVLTALEKTPQKRYTDMRQIIAALLRLKGPSS